ncbi:bifunctional adenosylcobinamide kinase/adenosylcobinamide-phosphate guanylyltransferase [Geothermobacter hydrogeniphilus]|uniref:Adenosylcobinamide kinase n=1 Tax=Geothermobacter hydrogeniphilus TaxID=1969733 RepID=A0A2K2H6A6_9BACT|nr:bifunctional adenosylcobinamide kinase/adenosylcobinamide-phosphate guanylyltransferase [Geothermobacter hydrogeniphilus]PNU18855.1 bifunctional adenosylcobinamide kinase/adenosylcobinamide-phosphate guanylyltransferase [Geothermobacter hydrogeniphilus]
MSRLVFITGGARSGKSGYAQRRCEELPGTLLYVATARVEDAEMAERVALHQQQRGERWALLEEPLDLAARLPDVTPGRSAVLLDCLTLWLTNQLFAAGEQPAPVIAAAEQLIETLRRLDIPIFVVSNEVGSGIVPDNALARTFRDLAGRVNQLFAASADEAWLLASGLPLRLK